LTNHAVELAGDMQEDLQHFYFSALHFCRMAEALSEHSLFDVTRAPNGSGTILCIRNVVPAQFLRPRLALARCAVLFSATLTPRHFYTDMLGLPANTRWLDVASPFSAEQLSIRVVHDVSTRYRHRAASTTPILELVAQQFAREPGNYLVFVSSFDYLERLVAGFATRHPHIPIWQQERSMRESERREFLERFEADGRGVGFAVLGGAFAEGVDLPGNRLIGAFIATLGLPQVNAINDQMMQRMQSLFGAGHEYTYLYPGLQKVTQAAGRIIRTTSDRGTLYLIDDRYAREEVLKLLPGWWRIGAERIFREPHPSVEESDINS
jgi:Rad3-related DNA helicase